MTRRLQVYETPEITVTFDPNLCQHSGVCLMGLPAVFDLRRKRWVQPEAADAQDVEATIRRCPSGALQFYCNTSGDPSAALSLARSVLLNGLAVVFSRVGERTERAAALASAIREARFYRWVGLYDVAGAEIAILAWSGGRPPAHPRFPADRGLSGAAVRARETVVSNDVRADPRYLEAFGDTRAEMVVPVIDPSRREVVGTIDVESERAGAFDQFDRALIEDCARMICPLWTEES
jgi:putative methionine-R-sulfoxide reductase with GAF domain/uncharacterized Fe-S cluster protein YjdI